jgi:hypothetical protein
MEKGLPRAQRRVFAFGPEVLGSAVMRIHGKLGGKPVLKFI